MANEMVTAADMGRKLMSKEVASALGTLAAVAGVLLSLFAAMYLLISDMRAEIKADLAVHRAEIRNELAANRAEIKSDLAANRAEFRADLAANRAEFKKDLQIYSDEIKKELTANNTIVHPNETNVQIRGE